MKLQIGSMLLVLMVSPVPAFAGPVDGIAAMGASETQGTSVSGSWVPYLSNLRGLNFGGPSNPYNVAVGGATSSSLLTQNQHTVTRDRVQNGLVDVAYLTIGGNDFNAVANQIVNGSLTGVALENWAQSIVDNILLASDTVASAGPEGIIVTSMPAMSLTPGGRLLANTQLKRQRADDAVGLVNSLLFPEISSRGYSFIDLDAVLRNINAQPLVVGGVTIDTVIGNSAPTFFFQDNIHPGVVGNGLLANLYISALNESEGLNVPLFTDLEILTQAGLAGSYTGETLNMNYSVYITVGVPEPASWVLGAITLTLIACCQHRASKPNSSNGGQREAVHTQIPRSHPYGISGN